MLFKVFTLTLKTVSKPLASRFERYVMGHPVLREKVISTAQWLHSLEVSITRGAEGKTGRVFVGDMSEERAMQMASKVASEGFVYGTALVLLVLEMYRKDKEDKEKKKKQLEDARRRHETDARIESELIEVREVLAQMQQRLDAQEDALHQRSWWSGGLLQRSHR